MDIFIWIQFVLKSTLPYRKINIEENHLLFWNSVIMMIIGFRIIDILMHMYKLDNNITKRI